MVDYTHALIWIVMWPAVIYIGYRFVKLNIEHIERKK